MGMFQCLGVPQQLLPFLICKSQGDSGELSCTHRTARPVIIHSLGIQLVLRLGIASDGGTCDSDSRALSLFLLCNLRGYAPNVRVALGDPYYSPPSSF